MKYIPILYSTDMVLACRAGTKTMTRRMKGLEMINNNPDEWILSPIKKSSNQFFSGVNPNPLKTFYIFENKRTGERDEAICPYGEARDQDDQSDVLWVRESFCQRLDDTYRYKADCEVNPILGWKPSIHMPKTACRMWLRVKEIGLERLQKISADNATKEGIKMLNDGTYCDYMTPSKTTGFVSPIKSFFTLWEKINGWQSLNANPWVWIVSFERIEKPEDWI